MAAIESGYILAGPNSRTFPPFRRGYWRNILPVGRQRSRSLLI